MCHNEKTGSTLNMLREEWLFFYRKLGIGGSDAGGVAGLNPYASTISVYQDKISDCISDSAVMSVIFLP